MKALSIWQPWASFIMSGHKKIETRSWPAPYPIRGQRIAIASTKAIRPEQRQALSEDSFRVHYAATGLPDFGCLPMGSVLGNIIVDGCREIDSEFLEDLDEQEEAFGWYGPGRFAWLIKDPEPLAAPIAVRGGQGLWNWFSRDRRSMPTS
jgi:activating signal cointegrator 1